MVARHALSRGARAGRHALCLVTVSTFNAGELTVKQLLQTYVSVLDELLHRGLIRTRNAPVGDLAEHLVWRAYGGSLAPNSTKSHDITAETGQRIQVKSRVVLSGAETFFSPFRSWDFDLAVFVVLDTRDYQVLWARELSASEASSLGRRVEHTNGTVLSTRTVRSAGSDVSDRISRALAGLDEV